MSEVRVAMLQILPTGTLQENLEKGLEYCEQAKKMGADIALFPEMWSCGYQFPQDREALEQLAITKDSKFITSFQKMAAKLKMAIGITFLEKCEKSVRNSICLFDRNGKEVYTYAKVHTCDFGEESILDQGEEFPVSVLETEKGKVKVGSMICYDREFPESARILMLKGAEILLVPNACPMEINRISQLRARAFENMLGIATVNYPKGQPDCNGHSTAFDGIACKPEEGFRDTLIVEADEGEGIVIADFPLSEMRAYRQKEVHGNAYRRPELYKPLLSPTINMPFFRRDNRKNLRMNLIFKI